MLLQAEHITIRRGPRTIVQDVSFTLNEGEWLMLAGPNGTGKSTLIEALAGGLPYTGRVLLNGKDARVLRPAQIARMLGVLTQHHAVPYAYTVEEIVSLGRYAHRGGLFGSQDAGASDAIERALSLTGMTALRHQSILSLSGGEQQRAFLAQVFAQDPQVLILDEPANHLDLGYQQQLFELIGSWLTQPHRAVLCVVHDLSLARRYGTHALLLDEGKVASQGLARSALSDENLAQVYHMDVRGWMRGLLSQWD